MKAMLDKSTASLSKAKDKEEPAVYVPTPAQREMLESESFEAAKFVSNRTTSKVSLQIYQMHLFCIQ